MNEVSTTKSITLDRILAAIEASPMTLGEVAGVLDMSADLLERQLRYPSLWGPSVEDVLVLARTVGTGDPLDTFVDWINQLGEGSA